MGKPIIFIGPSGSGKTSFAQYLIDNYNAMKIVSTTNRNKRENEIDGVHYHFKDNITIQNMINNNEFLEYSNYADNYYGITKKELENKINQADLIVNVMEIKGALKMKEYFPETVIIYCDVPIDTLMNRMYERGDSFQNIAKRVKNYTETKEYENIKYADFVLDNTGHIKDSYKKLESFLRI